MRSERRMNLKCHSRVLCDTFSARNAELTGLKMRRITRAVSLPGPPVLQTDRIAHPAPQETAALRDFNPAYDRLGSCMDGARGARGI